MNLLVVDDDPGLRRSLGMILADDGHVIREAADGARALERALAEPFDAILCDVRMPVLDGVAFLRRYRAAGGAALIIMMSAYGSEDAALAAMREGAYDYIAKPFRADEVTLVLRKAEERERLRREVESLRSVLGARAVSPDIVAESPAMRAALDIVSRVAPHPTTVLLTGPSGTGKEILAAEVHRLSPRASGPFIAINCAAIPDALLESELFGHARGAFTGAVADHRGLFEAAGGGSLFLDEIGDLPAPLQAKLLRVLQEGEVRRVGETVARAVDARIIAATARDLEADVREGRFREDLFYRLNVVAIHLPPLRERREDIPGLVRLLLLKHVKRLGVKAAEVEPDAMKALLGADWPGNVRELENALERAVVLAGDGVVRAVNLPASVTDVAHNSLSDSGLNDRQTLKRLTGEAQAEAIRSALTRAGGSRKEAARLLGVSVRTLFYKLKELGIDGT